MKRLRARYGEIFFVVLIILTGVARLLDALPASARDVEAVDALAASNPAARAFLTASVSANGSPSRKEVRRWRARIVAIEAAAARLKPTASERPMFGATQRTEIDAEHK